MRTILPIIFLLLTLNLVITQVTPPKSWNDASFFHWSVFYLPLFLLITSLLNLHFKFWLKSCFLGIGLTLLIALHGLNLLGPVTIILIVGGILFLLKYLKKTNPLQRAIRSPRALKLKRQ